MKKYFGYIYKTTNLVNDKVYVGQKKGEFSYSYLGSGKGLHYAIKKYGIDNFKIEWVTYRFCRKDLNEAEKYWIEYFRNLLGIESCYNICNGGEGFSGRKSPESILRGLLTKKRNGNDKPTEETISKRVEARRKNDSYSHSEETKERMSRSHTGKQHSKKTKRNISRSRQGKTLSMDHIRKIKESHNTIEYKKARSEEKLGDKNPMKRLDVVQKAKITRRINKAVRELEKLDEVCFPLV